jgi:hypothetical protein
MERENDRRRTSGSTEHLNCRVRLGGLNARGVQRPCPSAVVQFIGSVERDADMRVVFLEDFDVRGCDESAVGLNASGAVFLEADRQQFFDFVERQDEGFTAEQTPLPVEFVNGSKHGFTVVPLCGIAVPVPLFVAVATIQITRRADWQYFKRQIDLPGIT